MSDAVSRRYAQALISLAEEEGVVDRLGAELDRFVASSELDQRALATALESPVFTSEERRAVLERVLPKFGFHPLTANLLRLANDKRRTALIPSIALAYREIADQRAGRQRVVVQTAQPLTPELESEIRSALEAATRKTVILEAELRPELIGGLVARVGDKVYDSSIRNRLEQMKQALLNTTIPTGPIAQA